MSDDTRGKVLIADDEDAIVLGLARVLYQDNDKYDVLMARDGTIAQRVMNEIEIDVLVTDVRMPGLNGLDLLCWASAHSPDTRVIVITSFDVTRSEEQAYELGCLHFVQKPFDLHEMRRVIAQAVEQRMSGFGGSLSDLSPADVVQMLCLGRKSTAMRVVDGEQSGVVYFREGDVVHAVWDELSGEEAFYELIGASTGMFNTLPCPERVPQTIDANWQHLLLEGMRLQDERAAGRVPERKKKPAPQAAPARRKKRPTWPVARKRTVTGPSPVPRPAPPEPERRDPYAIKKAVAELIDKGFNAMRDGELATARAKWEEALGLEPENRMVELNLRRLENLEAKQ